MHVVEEHAGLVRTLTAAAACRAEVILNWTVRANRALLSINGSPESAAEPQEPRWHERQGGVASVTAGAVLMEVHMSKSKTRSVRPRTEPEPAPPPQHPHEGSKQALLVELLSRPEGASLDDLIGATGWLPHTTRAALTGLRRRGFAIERVPADGGRSLYRVAAPEPETTIRSPAPAGAAGRQSPRLKRRAEPAWPGVRAW